MKPFALSHQLRRRETGEEKGDRRGEKKEAKISKTRDKGSPNRRVNDVELFSSSPRHPENAQRPPKLGYKSTETVNTKVQKLSIRKSSLRIGDVEGNKAVGSAEKQRM